MGDTSNQFLDNITKPTLTTHFRTVEGNFYVVQELIDNILDSGKVTPGKANELDVSIRELFDNASIYHWLTEKDAWFAHTERVLTLHGVSRQKDVCIMHVKGLKHKANVFAKRLSLVRRLLSDKV